MALDRDPNKEPISPLDDPELEKILSEFRESGADGGSGLPDGYEDLKDTESWTDRIKLYTHKVGELDRGREDTGDPFNAVRDPDLSELNKRAREMKEFAEKAEKLRPGKPKAPEKPELFEFQLGPEFGEHFAPSDNFVMPEPETLHDPPKTERKGPGLLHRLRAREEAPPLPLPQAQARAQSYAGNLRARAVLAFVFLCPLLLISCAQTTGILPGFLSYMPGGKPYMTLFFMVLLQGLVMLCGIDILARGLDDLIRLRPGAETLVALSCMASLMQVASIVFRSSTEGSVLYNTVGFLPYCGVSAASVFFALWGMVHRQNAYARTYKTAAQEGTSGCVVSEERIWGGMPGFTRQDAALDDFVAESEVPDLVSRVTRFFAPLMIVAMIVLSILSASNHEGGQYFFWAFAAFCCAGVPMTTFGAFSYVFSRIAARLSHMGAALAGWNGAAEMSRGGVMVLTDGDLFPSGTMALNGLKILGDHSFENIIAMTASLLRASGSGLFKALETVVKDQSGYLRAVTNVKAFEGGMSGDIGGDRVMVGTLNFMHSMGIHVPPEYNTKSAVFTSVNHDLAGVLAVSYTPSSQVKGALLLVEGQNMTSVLAVRDVNITPTLLKEKFGVNPDLPEFPVIEERIALSDPQRQTRGKLSAVLTKDGLCPYAEAVIGGQRLHRFTVINLCIHLISLVLGMGLVFYFAYQARPVDASAISPARLLVFMFIWWAAEWLISCFSHRY